MTHQPRETPPVCAPDKDHILVPRGYFAYELLDRSLWVAGLLVGAYVVFPPAAASAEALRGPFELAPPWVWSGLAAAICVASALLAWWAPSWRQRACTAVLVVSLSWAGMLLMGTLVWHGPWRAVVSVWLYAGAASACYRLRKWL